MLGIAALASAGVVSAEVKRSRAAVYAGSRVPGSLHGSLLGASSFMRAACAAALYFREPGTRLPTKHARSASHGAEAIPALASAHAQLA